MMVGVELEIYCINNYYKIERSSKMNSYFFLVVRKPPDSLGVQYSFSVESFKINPPLL